MGPRIPSRSTEPIQGPHLPLVSAACSPAAARGRCRPLLVGRCSRVAAAAAPCRLPPCRRAHRPWIRVEPSDPPPPLLLLAPHYATPSTDPRRHASCHGGGSPPCLLAPGKGGGGVDEEEALSGVGAEELAPGRQRRLGKERER